MDSLCALTQLLIDDGSNSISASIAERESSNVQLVVADGARDDYEQVPGQLHQPLLLCCQLRDACQPVVGVGSPS